MNCSQLYVGVDARLEESRSEVFSLMLVPSGSQEGKALRGVLGTQHVYYLAPHCGCGCGWDHLDVGGETDELNRLSCEALGRFLRSVEQSPGFAKLHSVCIDSLGTPPGAETRLTADEFMEGIAHLRIGYCSPGARVFVLGAGAGPAARWSRPGR